jgi:hydrogenase maturation protease
MPLTVIGMGNRLCGDDSVGPVILDALKTFHDKRMELVEGGVDALALLELLAQREHALVIDATRMGLDPGAIRAFSRHDVEMIVTEEHLSLHGMGMAEALQLGEQLGMLPEDLKFIGIQPLSVNVNTPLSEPVAASVSAVIDLVIEELQTFEPAADQLSMQTHVDLAHEGK